MFTSKPPSGIHWNGFDFLPAAAAGEGLPVPPRGDRDGEERRGAHDAGQQERGGQSTHRDPRGAQMGKQGFKLAKLV